MKLIRIGGVILANVFVAAIVGGFVLGFVKCEDTDGLGVLAIFPRFVVGCVYAVLTPLFAGFPPRDEAGLKHFNAWPYMIVSWIVMFALFDVIQYFKRPKEPS